MVALAVWGSSWVSRGDTPRAGTAGVTLHKQCVGLPLPSKNGTNKPVKSRFWPWLEPFFRKSLQPFKLPPPRSTAVPAGCEGLLGTVCTGGSDVIRKEALPFYRTLSGVRLCWELEEPKGHKGRGASCSQVYINNLCSRPRRARSETTLTTRVLGGG